MNELSVCAVTKQQRFLRNQRRATSAWWLPIDKFLSRLGGTECRTRLITGYMKFSVKFNSRVKVSALPTVMRHQDGAISYRLFGHASCDYVHAHTFLAPISHVCYLGPHGQVLPAFAS